jgi:hypothetical protein
LQPIKSLQNKEARRQAVVELENAITTLLPEAREQLPVDLYRIISGQEVKGQSNDHTKGLGTGGA